VPAETIGLYGWSRTPRGLVATLMTSTQAGGYSDQYVVSYLDLLRPAARFLSGTP
jgi:hypothetical protein